MKSHLKLSLYSALAVIVIVLYGCSGGYERGAAEVALSDTTSVYGFNGNEAKLVKTAGIHLKVKHAEEATQQVAALARSYGGMLFSYQLSANDLNSTEVKLSDDSLLVITASSPQSSITARVPSQHLEQFMFDIASVGYFTGSAHLKIEDKSLVYLQHALMQANRENAVKNNTQQRKPLDAKGMLQVKDEAIEKEVSRRQIDGDANYSNVSLLLYQNPVIRKEKIANHNISDYQLPFFTRLAHSVGNGWQMCLSFLLTIINLWFVLLLIVTGVAAYRILHRKYRFLQTSKP